MSISSVKPYQPIVYVPERRSEEYSHYRKTVDKLISYSQKLDEFIILSDKLEKKLKGT